jgi:alpha-mannosidase
MSSWEIGQFTERTDLLAGASTRLDDAGPARATVQSRHQWGSSTLTLSTTLVQGVASIIFRLVVDWHEKGGDRAGVPGVLVCFPIGFGDATATYDIPFGAIRRPMTGRDVPALAWVDVSGVSSEGAPLGFTLANDGRHGFAATERELVMKIVRSSYEPDLEPDQGIHEVGYTLAPHAGGCDERASALLARAFNQPLVAAIGTSLASGLPASAGLLEIESEAAVASTLKLSEEGGQLVVRLFETRGTRTGAVLRFGFEVASVKDADPLERPTGVAVEVAASRCAIVLAPFEIRTLLVSRPPAPDPSRP